ncbi:MAG: phosphatidate cytidylyltransferase [Planctomycetota bacterium]|nr:phosphatidate cytidylyltransferase [Planctomycetota bacterium]
MLRFRILAATCMVSMLIVAMWLDYYYLRDSFFLHLTFLGATYLGMREFWTLCRGAGYQTFSHWGTLCACALVGVHYLVLRTWAAQNAPGTPTDPAAQFKALYQAEQLLNGALAASILGVFVLTARRKDLPASLGGLSVTTLGLLYLWFLPSFVLKLRHMGLDGLPGGEGWNAFGHRMVIATIVIAKGCDVCAFLVGRRLGRHKAFPLVSPGKTIEGVAAGLAGSVILAVILHLEVLNVLPSPAFSIPKALVFGLCVGFSGMMGDLAESLLKRSAGVKDAGQLVPGYGGVMDVVDSLVVAGPVAYFLVPVIIAY